MTEAGRQRRIAYEARLVAEARASVAVGRLVDSAEVKVWIDSIGTNRDETAGDVFVLRVFGPGQSRERL